MITRSQNKLVNRFAVVFLVVSLIAISTPSTALGDSASYSDAGRYGCWQYIVRRGDNLSRLAVRYGTTIRAIQSANGLRSTKILIGQSLCIPDSLPPAGPPSPAPRHEPPFNKCPLGWTCIPPVVNPPCVYSNGCVPQTYNTWNAEFFQGLDTINGPLILEVPGYASTIYFYWPTGSPYPGIPTGNWSLRLRQSIYMSGGNYVMTASADNGALVWIDKDMVINNWGNSPAWTVSGKTHASVAEGWHTITIAYRHVNGPGTLSVVWSQQ